MRLIALITFVMITLVGFAAEKKTEVFTLDHQMSEMCKKKITENLRFEKGISKIDVSLKENTITITYDPKKTDTEKIIAAFKKIGFNACLYEKSGCCKEGSGKPCDSTPCHQIAE